MPISNVLKPNDHGWPIKLWTKDIEQSALDQVVNLSAMPFIHKHVAVMPDAHAGIGSTVGTVIATDKAIIPAAVGVDIGCGMMACKLPITAEDLPDNLHEIRSAIESVVPHGRTDNGGINDRGAFGTQEANSLGVSYLLAEHGIKKIATINLLPNGKISTDLAGDNLISRFENLSRDNPKLYRFFDKLWRQIGTLGTGNHFIELCLDTNNAVWIMLHSGSRGIGNAIGMYYIQLAKEDMRKWFINLPDEDLAYLPEGTDHFAEYITAMTWAQDYAAANREVMMQNIWSAISPFFNGKLSKYMTSDEIKEKAIQCHHNFCTKENHFGRNVWITRKGAVRARQGDMGIIPGSMGTKSYIVRGLGNKDSFESCSHGAGRRMSRNEARKRFTVQDLEQQTSGVECRKDSNVIDEIPGAYKDIDQVMQNQNDLVEIVTELKQVLCVKG